MACDTTVTVSNKTSAIISVRTTALTWPDGGMSPLQRHIDTTNRYGSQDDQTAKTYIASLRSGVTTTMAPNVSLSYENEGEVNYIRDVCADLESAGLTVVFVD